MADWEPIRKPGLEGIDYDNPNAYDAEEDILSGSPLNYDFVGTATAWTLEDET